MQFAPLFQHHAVLQRHAPIPVWGSGTPGERVTVRLAEDEALTTVNAAGRWFLRLPARGEGGPYTLRAEAPSGVVEIDDILIGEVWLCSGQSNMAWTLERIGGEPNPPTLSRVRLLSVANHAELGRTEAVEGQWKPCTPAALAAFSAVGGYFGRRLHEALDVPIGLICNAWGGTRVQAWISREGLMQEPEGRDEIRHYESALWQPGGVRTQTFEEWEQHDAPRDTGNLGLPAGYASPAYNDAGWESMELPGFWQQRGHPYSGIFWFRRSIELPASWAGRELELSLGAIDKHDEAWVNGCPVGATGRETKNAWALLRRYPISAEVVDKEKARLTVALRVSSHVFAGGFTGPAEAMWIAPVDAPPEERLSLAGAWASKVEQNWGAIAPPASAWGAGNPNSPGILFDNRIAPLLPYAIRGVIWYQGEGNVGEANLYRRFIARLIHDWRHAWGAGDFPFIQVQLANFNPTQEAPSESKWAALREAQASALALEATGLAVAIDIGEADDVHPRNKRDVGARLAQNALHSVYHHMSAPVPMGPLFTGITIEAGGRVRCFFRHTAGELVARGGALRHFAVAGRDRQFHWAQASIEGETIVVSSPEVAVPYAVRYAWADNPEGCNLYNRLGLPAVPFRSDSWPVT